MGRPISGRSQGIHAMKLSRRRVAALTVLFLVSGCGGGGGARRSASGTSTAASTSATSSTRPTAATTTSSATGGSPTSTVTPVTVGKTSPGTVAGSTGAGSMGSTGSGATTTVATPHYGPLITVSSPARGAFLAPGVVKVEGTVTDPRGVALFTIQGQPVQVSTSGAFATVVPLTVGLNTIVCESANPYAQWSKTSLSVVAGTFLPESQPIKDALVSRLNQSTFDAIAKVAASKMGGSVLSQQIMARNPLYRNALSAFGVVVASAEVNATKANFGQPTLALTCVANGLEVTAEIPQIDIAVNAKSYGGIPYSITGNVTADKAVIMATCNATIVNGKVTTQVTACDVQLQGFKWGISGFPSLLTNLASGFVKKTIEDEIEKQLKSVVPAEVDKALAAATSQPFTQTVMGTTASVSFAPTYTAFDALGHSLRLDADVKIAPIASFVQPTSPGSLVSAGGVPTNGGPTPSFAVSLNEDLANRAGHAAWRAGLLDLTIDAAAAQKLGLPVWLPLDAGLLQLFFPELVGKMPASDPIAFTITAKLPPIVQAKTKPETVQTSLGDLTLEIYDVAPGKPQTLILSIALHAQLKATATLGAGNVLKVNVPSRPSVDGSLVASPLAPTLNPTGLVAFVQFAMPPVIQIVGNTWNGAPLPLYPGLAPKNVDVDADGAQKTFITVRGDF